MIAFAPLMSVLTAVHDYIEQQGDNAAWIMKGILPQLQQAAVFEQLPALVEAVVQQLAEPVSPTAILVLQETAADPILIPEGALKVITDLWQSTAWLLDALRSDELTALQDRAHSADATQREAHHVAALAAVLAAAALQHATRVQEQQPAAAEPPAELQALVYAAGLSIMDHNRHVVLAVTTAVVPDGATSTGADMQQLTGAYLKHVLMLLGLATFF
jgi:hypothetical protein